MEKIRTASSEPGLLLADQRRIHRLSSALCRGHLGLRAVDAAHLYPAGRRGEGRGKIRAEGHQKSLQPPGKRGADPGGHRPHRADSGAEIFRFLSGKRQRPVRHRLFRSGLRQASGPELLHPAKRKLSGGCIPADHSGGPEHSAAGAVSGLFPGHCGGPYLPLRTDGPGSLGSGPHPV